MISAAVVPHSTDPKEVLRLSAQYFRENPTLWNRGAYGLDQEHAHPQNLESVPDILDRLKDPRYCRFCTVGILFRHSSTERTFQRTTVLVAAALGVRNAHSEGVIIRWNDDRPETTVDEVIDLLERAGK